MKKIKFHLKRGLNLVLTLLFTAALFTLLMFLIYRPTYKISFKGKFIGYSRDVFNIKNKVHESIFNGDDKVAYYEIDEKPEYEFTFMKAQFVPDDTKIIDEIKMTATPVYKTYAVKEKDKIKARVSSYSEASKILSELKKKESDNLEDISIELEYEKEEPKLTDTTKVVADLFVEKPEPVYVAVYRNYASVSRGVRSMQQVDIPISLRVPLSRAILITTPFGFVGPADGYPTYTFHEGLDFNGNRGDSIIASAAGRVESAGNLGSYGNSIKIDHGNGVKTFYAHASSIEVSVGQEVAAGQRIGGVGNTGYSFGNHLHFEVEYNGMILNPRFYLNI